VTHETGILTRYAAVLDALAVAPEGLSLTEVARHQAAARHRAPAAGRAARGRLHYRPRRPQGQGYALSEDMIYQEGRLMTPSFSEYLIPTAMDMPEVKSIILESRSGLGPFATKSIGEPALTPVAPAIANAVAEPIGTRVFELPITPERVVAALHKAESTKGQK
jgi:hypothetical protein